MKVICIARPAGLILPEWEKWIAKVGHSYNVTSFSVYPDGLFYRLEEMPDFCIYHEELFVLPPVEDADEMQENAKESIVNIETAIV